MEYFTTTADRATAEHDRHQVAAALLDAAAHTAAADPAGMPTCLARHLPGHAAVADLWDTLAAPLFADSSETRSTRS